MHHSGRQGFGGVTRELSDGSESDSKQKMYRASSKQRHPGEQTASLLPVTPLGQGRLQSPITTPYTQKGMELK